MAFEQKPTVVFDCSLHVSATKRPKPQQRWHHLSGTRVISECGRTGQSLVPFWGDCLKRMDVGELFLPLGIRHPLQHIGGFVAESTRPNELVNLRMDHNQVRRRAVLF